MKECQYFLLSVLCLTIVGCNSGSSDTSSPSAKPLEITQNVIPSLNKIGSHQIWYMVIKNPNDFQLDIAGIRFQGLTPNKLDPTKYVLPYDGAINGVTADCLKKFNLSAAEVESGASGLQAGQSCAYKFEARWGYNSGIDPQQKIFPFKMFYSFWNTNSSSIYGELNYEYKDTCTEENSHLCLPDNQNLYFNQELKTPLKELDINKVNNLVTAKNISMNGDYAWSINLSESSASVYSINYNSDTNSTNLQLESSYSGDWFNNTDSSVLSYDGLNWFNNIYYQQGLIGLNPFYNFVQWVYGLDNNIYGMNYNLPYWFVKLNQNQADIMLSTVTNIANFPTTPNIKLLGVSAKLNILVSQFSSGTTRYYCYYAQDGYQNKKEYAGYIDPSSMVVTPKGYYFRYRDNITYTDIDKKDLTTFNINKIDVDNCLTDYSNYFAFDANATEDNYFLALRLNQKFGVVEGLHYQSYMDTYDSFSNGLNGGN